MQRGDQRAGVFLRIEKTTFFLLRVLCFDWMQMTFSLNLLLPTTILPNAIGTRSHCLQAVIESKLGF